MSKRKKKTKGKQVDTSSLPSVFVVGYIRYDVDSLLTTTDNYEKRISN